MTSPWILSWQRTPMWGDNAISKQGDWLMIMGWFQVRLPPLLAHWSCAPLPLLHGSPLGWLLQKQAVNLCGGHGVCLWWWDRSTVMQRCDVSLVELWWRRVGSLVDTAWTHTVTPCKTEMMDRLGIPDTCGPVNHLLPNWKLPRVAKEQAVMACYTCIGISKGEALTACHHVGGGLAMFGACAVSCTLSLLVGGVPHVSLRGLILCCWAWWAHPSIAWLSWFHRGMAGLTSCTLVVALLGCTLLGSQLCCQVAGSVHVLE